MIISTHKTIKSISPDDFYYRSSRKAYPKYKFLDRYGEIGEYIRLELKLLLRNKVCRKSLYSVTAIVLIFSLTISFSDIYDGGSRDFFVLYNYIIFGILFLSPLMSYEGNYIDGLMSRKESIYSLLRAKYILYSIALIIPFVLMIPGMVTGKVSVLECIAWIIFVPDHLLIGPVSVGSV